MLRKSLFWKILGILLIMLLVFSACSTGSDGTTIRDRDDDKDDGGDDDDDEDGNGNGNGGETKPLQSVPASTIASNPGQLNTLLASSSYSGVQLTGPGTITMDSNLTIPASKTLKLNNVEISTPTGKTATIAGTVILNANGKVSLSSGGTCESTGTITIDDSGEFFSEGGFTNSGAITVRTGGDLTLNSGTFNNLANGTVIVNSGGDFVLGASGTNNGTITIRSGATVTQKNNVRLAGAGFTVVEAGGKAIIEISGSSPITMISNSDSPVPVLKLTNGQVSFNDTSFILEGTANLKDSYYASSDTQLTVKSCTLTIDSGKTLTATYSVDSKPAVKGEGSAKIVVSSTGKIAFPNSSGISGLPGFNFYSAANTLVNADINPSSSSETYNWNTAAATAGGNKPGWLKQ
jgi:hypothetical protein